MRCWVLATAAFAAWVAGTSCGGNVAGETGRPGSIGADCRSDADCTIGASCVSGVCASDEETVAAGTARGAGGATSEDDDAPSFDPPPFECDGACCPTSPECYPPGNPASGRECLAQRDNTGETIMLRQTWLRATLPVGSAIPVVYAIQANGSDLPAWDACNMSDGTGGYMHLLEIDLDAGEARSGYARWIDDAAEAVRDGLCIVADNYAGYDNDDVTVALGPDGMTDPSAFPAGLPAPMPQADASGTVHGWDFGPLVSRRVDSDFDLRTDRETILDLLANDTDYAGVYYYDDATGFFHAYAPVSFVVLYSAADILFVVPLREAETRFVFNDPASPNCVGRYRHHALDPASQCISADPDNPEWGCVDDVCPAFTDMVAFEGSVQVGADVGRGPAVTSGYHLISELDQVWADLLASSLCKSFPGFDEAGVWAGGWNIPPSVCSRSPHWDPTARDNAGIPDGDWCAATNSPATASCHDAYRSLSFHTYAGFDIQPGTCPL